MSFLFTFEDVNGVTYPVSRYISVGEASFEIDYRPDQDGELRLGIKERSWKGDSALIRSASARERLLPVGSVLWDALNTAEQSGPPDLVREPAEQYGEPLLSEDDIVHLSESQDQLALWLFQRWGAFVGIAEAPYAGAPVRSKPRRTYDPSRPIPDPEGEYIPSYLSIMSRRDPDAWKKLKESLEKFGSASGLFDEISIESFGQTGDATPFQIQIRKFGGQLKGKRRNLIDVGYGVSQTLPIITELLRPDSPSLFLLQQP